MRPLYTTFLLALALFGGVAAYGQLVANNRFLEHASQALRDWSKSLPAPAPEEAARLVAEARRRAKLYDDQIVANHLVDGMVVNRQLDTGRMLDQCDSLLFSSLRFVSLVKLGEQERADTAWAAIQKSQRDGHWFRHPRCPKSTSRDMLLGLLIALSQQPEGFDKHLTALMQRVEKHNGYFSTGPIYVSYLSPGLARLMAMLAPAGKLPARRLPDIVREGYSTAELEVLVTDRGYESHLGALTAWLEMEIGTRQPEAAAAADGGALAAAATALAAPFSSGDGTQTRLDWITHQLVQNDPKNLFFRYLRLRAAGALTPAVRRNLLAELLSLPQFPSDHLPMNCDRRADYLWQRAWRDPIVRNVHCTEEFNGTDYLWMASLLLEGSIQPTLISH